MLRWRKPSLKVSVSEKAEWLTVQRGATVEGGSGLEVKSNFEDDFEIVSLEEEFGAFNPVTAQQETPQQEAPPIDVPDPMAKCPFSPRATVTPPPSPVQTAMSLSEAQTRHGFFSAAASAPLDAGSAQAPTPVSVPASARVSAQTSMMQVDDDSHDEADEDCLDWVFAGCFSRRP